MPRILSSRICSSLPAGFSEDMLASGCSRTLGPAARGAGQESAGNGVSVTKSDFIMQDLLSRIYCLEFRSGKLPTQRQLALEYGVSRSTVQEALRGLEKIGAIRAQQGSGIFVREKLLLNPLVFNSLTRASYTDIESRMLSLEHVPASPEEQRSF